MPNRKVIDLNGCRDLLTQWSAVRDRILAGDLTALAVCARDRTGRETVAFCGDYARNSKDALSAAMAMSWELTKQEKAKLRALG